MPDIAYSRIERIDSINGKSRKNAKKMRYVTVFNSPCV